MKNEELKNLISKIANSQDKEAFSKIFDYFAPKLLGYLINSGISKDISEEITQEVLTTIWQKAHLFNYQKAKVNTWIFTIARNKKIDRIRKDTNPTYNPLDLISALYSDKDNKNIESQEKIVQMQSKLNENENKIIKMNFFEGKTHKNISQELEIPLGTVKSRIRNILCKMESF